MENSNIASILISGGVTIVTVFGVQFLSFITKKREELNKTHGKEFDDGVERRKELIREIDTQRKVIETKDMAIQQHIVRIEALKDEISRNVIKYIVLENKYKDVVDELSRFSADVAAKFILKED